MDGKIGEQISVVKSFRDVLVGNLAVTARPRGPIDTTDHLHLVAGVFVHSPGTGRYLIQKRATDGRTYPGHFTDSASGHVSPVQDPLTLDAIRGEMTRELSEEMGVLVDPAALRLWTIFQEPVSNEIKFVFTCPVDSEDLDMDPAEVDVEGSGWRDVLELQGLLEKEPFVPSMEGLWRKLVEIGPGENFLYFYRVLQEWDDHTRHFSGLSSYIAWRERNKDKDVAAFIGRFQPFHRGHLECLHRIAEQHDAIFLGVGSAQYGRMKKNPLHFRERREMLEKVIDSPDGWKVPTFIVPLPDIHAEALWMNNVLEITGRDVTFYTNNDWVRGLVKKEGVSIGKKMEFDVDACNGTRIRQMIAQGNDTWRSLVPRETAQYLESRDLLGIMKDPGIA